MASKNSKGFMAVVLDGLFGSVEAIIAGVVESARQSTEDFIRRVARNLLLLFLALLGIIFFLVGGARMLSDVLERPGLGDVLVGSVILLVALVSYSTARDGKE